MTTGYSMTGKRLGDLEHGEDGLLIRCKCGLTYRREKFMQHLRDAEQDRITLAIERSMQHPARPSQPPEPEPRPSQRERHGLPYEYERRRGRA